MYAKINIFGAALLLLILAALFIVSRTKTMHKGCGAGSHSTKYNQKERRAHPRYKTSLRVKYRTSVNEGVSWIKDISRGGARLFLNNALKSVGIGELLDIEVNIPYETKPIFIRGSVVWFKGDDAGLRFIEMVQQDIDRIMQHVKIEEDAGGA